MCVCVCVCVRLVLIMEIIFNCTRRTRKTRRKGGNDYFVSLRVVEEGQSFLSVSLSACVSLFFSLFLSFSLEKWSPEEQEEEAEAKEEEEEEEGKRKLRFQLKEEGNTHKKILDAFFFSFC